MNGYPRTSWLELKVIASHYQLTACIETLVFLAIHLAIHPEIIF